MPQQLTFSDYLEDEQQETSQPPEKHGDLLERLVEAGSRWFQGMTKRWTEIWTGWCPLFAGARPGPFITSHRWRTLERNQKVITISISALGITASLYYGDADYNECDVLRHQGWYRHRGMWRRDYDDRAVVREERPTPTQYGIRLTVRMPVLSTFLSRAGEVI